MLQWMGGSRRKVTTSRKSTYKRQKQYFEQRRRQQQHNAGLEDSDDGKYSCNRYRENNRSLDILSLMNVSTVAKEHTASCLSVRDNSEDEHFVWDTQNAQLPAIDTNEDILVDQSEQNEERTSLSYPTEAEYSKKVSLDLPDHSENFVGNGNKPDHLKLSTMPHAEISVIDLLGDGVVSSPAEEISEHLREAHVAFSVEGLGKVETETPVRSPDMPGRRPVKGFSSPRKASRRRITFEQLNNSFDELDSREDVMMRDILFSQYGSSIEERFCSREMMDSNLKQKFFNFRNSSPFNSDTNTLKGVSSNDEFFFSIQDRARNIWDDPSFLDDNTDNLRNCELFPEKWTGKRNVNYDDFSKNKDRWRLDFNFEGWNLQNDRSSTRRTDNFDVTESPVSYLENLTPKSFSNFNVSNIRYSTIGTDSIVKDTVNNFMGEDTRETLSLLSEESCSSTAVRGDAMKKP